MTKRKGRARSQSTPQPVLRPRRTLRRSQPTRDRSPDSGESSDESPIRPQARTPTPPPPPRPTTPVDLGNDFSKVGTVLIFQVTHNVVANNEVTSNCVMTITLLMSSHPGIETFK